MKPIVTTPGTFGDEVFNGTINGINEFLDTAGIDELVPKWSESAVQFRLNSFYNEFIRMQKKLKDMEVEAAIKATVETNCGKRMGAERRKERLNSPGSDLDLIMVLECASLGRQLSEDDRETMAQAQSRIRQDGTANGFRKFDRRRS